MSSESLPADAFATLRAIVEDRRTNMLVDRDREVSEDIVRDLCELAMWAPNHKRTWPWRFAAFSGDGRVRLGEACAQDLIAGGSDDEFMCDDGETIPMDWVNDGEADCAGGEDEGYVWTFTYDNCADSDHGLSSLDCWDAEWDVDGDGVPEDSNSYWNYECEQLADGTWECMTDQINYYDNCAYEGEDYYECWLNEWDTDDDGSYDLGSDGYMDSECEQLADGRWACSHSDGDGGDGMLTPELVLEFFDTDGDSMLSWDEFWDSYEKIGRAHV